MIIKLLRVAALSHPVDSAFRKEEVEPISGPSFNPGHTFRSKVLAFNITIYTLGIVECVDFAPGASVCVNNQLHLPFLPLVFPCHSNRAVYSTPRAHTNPGLEFIIIHIIMKQILRKPFFVSVHVCVCVCVCVFQSTASPTALPQFWICFFLIEKPFCWFLAK